MIKKLMVFAVLAASASIAAPSQAACAGVQYGASVGNAVNVNDSSDVVSVRLIADTVWACDDGTVTSGDIAIPSTLTITGTVRSCEARTSSDWDPFGFGTGIHDDLSDTACSADISWGGFLSVWGPDMDESGADTDGATVAAGKDGTVENGIVFVDGNEYHIDAEWGRMWRGAGASA